MQSRTFIPGGHARVAQLITVACLTLTVACGDDAAPLSPATTVPTFAKGGSTPANGSGRIFFTGYTPGQQTADIFVMNPDGSGVTQLTTPPGSHVMPSAPLDGRSVVFATYLNNHFDIYSMKSDGTGVVRLTTSEYGDFYPAISPDGRRVAFMRRNPVGGQVDLYVMRPNGTNIVQVTNDAAQESFPTFSPDGQQIAFERREISPGGDREVYRVNVDGTGLVNLTNNPTTDDGTPAWSPDGSLIAFGSERDGQDATGAPDTYTMNPDGSNVIRRTAIDPGGAERPAWSPDSKKLVFFNWAGAEPVVYTMNLDGTGLNKIPLQASSFSWTR